MSTVARIQKPCSYPPCHTLVDSGRCDAHRPLTNRYADVGRGTSSERGYDADWQRFRAMFLCNYPLCSGSGADWRNPYPPPDTRHLMPATEVHHIVKLRDNKELRLVESNCLPQCKTCHSIRTGRGE